MTSTTLDPDAPPPAPRARVAVRRTLEEAEDWADLLRAHDLDALVEIDDARDAQPGRTLLPGLGFPGPMFAYPVTVPLADRARAASLLEEFVEAEEPVAGGTLLRGAIIALVLGAGALALRVALG